MVIFSNFDFKGGKEESRKLLARAIDLYNANFYPECAEDSEALLSKLELSDKGKPSIPGWMNFSISHSENCWAILIDEEPCGLDVQYKRDCKIDQIANRWYAPEDAELALKDEADFWRIWTRREACVKALGESVMTEVPSVADDTVEIDSTVWDLLDVELIGASEVPYSAICTLGPAQTLRFYRI